MKIRKSLMTLLGVFALTHLAPFDAHAAAQRGASKKAPVAKESPARSAKLAKAAKVVAVRPTKPIKFARADARRAKRAHVAHAASAAPAAAPDMDNEGNPLLHSAAFMIADQATGSVLLEKNSDAVLPIASITKLMTAMVVLDARLSLSEVLVVANEDVDTLRNSSSHVPVGTELAREDMLRLALMSSENRAASALGRNYPGGLPAFVAAMNRKAAASLRWTACGLPRPPSAGPPRSRASA